MLSRERNQPVRHFQTIRTHASLRSEKLGCLKGGIDFRIAVSLVEADIVSKDSDTGVVKFFLDFAVVIRQARPLASSEASRALPGRFTPGSLKRGSHQVACSSTMPMPFCTSRWTRTGRFSVVMARSW